jgi:hypothetical protein
MPTWIWVRDDTTGACYDVEEKALRRGMTPVEGYPPNSGPGARPRRAKPFVGKDGQPDTPGPRDEPATAPPPDEDPAPPADTNEEQS